MSRHKVILKQVSLQSDLKGIVLALASIQKIAPKEAVDLVKNLPLTVISNCPSDQALKFYQLFTDMGAKVELDPAVQTSIAKTDQPISRTKRPYWASSWRLALILFIIVALAGAGLYWGGFWIMEHVTPISPDTSGSKMKALMKSSQGEIESARDQVNAQLKNHPDNVDLLVQKAVVFLGMARKKMESQGWVAYGSQTTNIPEVGQDLMPLAEADSALRTLYRAREINGNRADVYRWLAEIYMQKGLAAESIPFAKRATEIESQNIIYWNLLGLVYQEADQIGQSELAFRHAQKLNPQHTETWRNLGILLVYHQGDTLQGMEFLRRYLLKESGKDMDRYLLRQELMAMAWAQYNLLWNPKNSEQRSFQEYEQERSRLQAQLLKNQKNALAHEQLGVLYALRSMFDEALLELRRATLIDPSLELALKMQVLIMAKQGEWDGVAGALQKAAKIPNCDLFFIKNLGLIHDYYRLDPESAKDFYRLYVQKGGDEYTRKLLTQRAELMR